MSILYTVQFGDSLPYIAKRFGITLPRLAQMNNIYSPYLIYTGQKLIIPVEGNSQQVNGAASNHLLTGTIYTSAIGYAGQEPIANDQEAVEKIIGKKGLQFTTICFMSHPDCFSSIFGL